MEKENFDQTQILPRAKQGETGKTEDLEDTQSLPAVGEDEQPAPGEKSWGVRELSPLEQEIDETRDKKTFWTRKRKKTAFLIGGFLVALFFGFFLAGYAGQQSEKAQQAKIQQEELAKKQDNIQQETKNLEQKKAELEQQKKDLEAKRQTLLAQSARADGKSEQIDSEASSGLGKLVDKVTGRDKKRQQDAAAAAAEKQEAASQTDSIDQSIASAQQMLDDVNGKLESAAAMKKEADGLKAQAENAYAENQGTIDTVLSYVKTGAQMVGNLLFH